MEKVEKKEARQRISIYSSFILEVSKWEVADVMLSVQLRVTTISLITISFNFLVFKMIVTSVRIEGIEDVDIILKDTINAVQCKYYDETSCSPSVIGKSPFVLC